MTEYELARVLGVAFWVFLSGVLVAVAVWLVRRFASRQAQWWLLMPLSAVIRRLAGSALAGLQAVFRRAPATPGPSVQHRVGRD